MKLVYICRAFFKNGGLMERPRSEKQNKELYIFEKGFFWSGLRRNSRVAKSEKWEWGVRRGDFAWHIPVLSLYGSTPPPLPPGLGF